MDVLITGTTGFIGKQVKDNLQQQGYHLVEVNRKAIDGQFTFDEAFAGKCSARVWLHLAARSKDGYQKSLQHEYHKANVELTAGTYKAFLKDEAAAVFIFMSSVKAAASHPPHALTEQDELEVDAPYGLSKRLAEQYLLSIPLPPDKKLIILRPAMVYGNNRESNLYSLYKFVKRGFPYPFAAFNNARNLLYMGNLLFTLSHIIRHENFRAGIYNVADDDAVSVNQLIGWMAQAMNKKPFLLRLPKPLFRFAAKMGDSLHLPFNTKILGKLTDDYKVSNQKLLHELGVPLPYTAAQVMQQLFKDMAAR